MDFYVSARVTQEQILAEQARRQAALQCGKSFIVLSLKDKKRRRLSGVEVILPKRVEDEEGDMTWEFAQGQGPLVFEPDPARGGIFTAYLLDTEWNRAILGSHYTLGIWKIVDVINGNDEEPVTLQAILDDVRGRAQSSMNQALRVNPDDLLPAGPEALTDDDIDAEIERLKKIKEGREKDKSEEPKRKRKPRKAPVEPEPENEPEDLVVVNS